MSIFFLVLLVIAKVKTSEALQCYGYCLGSEAACENISREVGNTLNCTTDEVCMAQQLGHMQSFECIEPEEVKKCERQNRIKNVCVTCDEDLCNTVEKLEEVAGSRTQCYTYCTESECMAKTVLPNEPTSGPCGLKTRHCVGMKINDGDYYDCSSEDFEEKCRKFNQQNSVCLFCEGNLCNKQEIVAELEKSRLHCYHHCTKNMCENFGTPWYEGHQQLCSSSAIGCVGTKMGKKGGHLFQCVERKETALEICEDAIEADECIYCHTNLCNSPDKITSKLHCYSFCFQPVEEMKICETADSPAAHKVICPETKRAGCMVLKLGSSEIYACASEEDREKCSEMNKEGEGICVFCENSLCNSQSAINAVSKKFLPLGVSMCYFFDGKSNQSKTSVISCKFPYRIKYKCMSAIKEQPDGSSVLLKNCITKDDAESYTKCDSNVKNGKKLCYICKQDLCNKNNFTDVDLGQKIMFCSSSSSTFLVCGIYVLAFFPLL